jgi:hypothetical protein
VPHVPDQPSVLFSDVVGSAAPESPNSDTVDVTGSGQYTVLVAVGVGDGDAPGDRLAVGDGLWLAGVYVQLRPLEKAAVEPPDNCRSA